MSYLIQVGDVGDVDGLAPGERKRLTIAVELVSNSPVIFLGKNRQFKNFHFYVYCVIETHILFGDSDEPTSGLDARSAAVVLRVIKKMADTGRTVMYGLLRRLIW